MDERVGYWVCSVVCHRVIYMTCLPRCVHPKGQGG